MDKIHREAVRFTLSSLPYYMLFCYQSLHLVTS